MIAPTADPLLHAPPRATVSVLVVDDDPTIRGLVRRVLEHEGHAVREAPSGRGALALLQEGAPVEAVVTDLKMGDGSGGWFLAHLAYEFPALLPRTLVISGDPGGAGTAHVVARWRCPVLAKPFTASQLVAAISGLGSPLHDQA
jgi:CheY-like chemotaxis protein